MKKTYVIFIVSGLILAAVSVWFFTSRKDLKPVDLSQNQH
jgi:hypothetical protein